MLPLVLPCEAVLPPHVGEAKPARIFLQALFEREEVAVRVYLGGCRMADESAYVYEVLLRPRAFTQCRLSPLTGKLMRCHGSTTRVRDFLVRATTSMDVSTSHHSARS